MPSESVRVSPDEPNPTHHLRLRGGDYDIPLITCEPDGTPSPLAIQRDRLVSTSLKITEGNPKHSDFELPFTPMSQEDFSGGRGNERFEDDVTRFLDSRNLNTMHDGKVFLAGQQHLTKGYRNIQYNIQGSVSWQSLLPSGDRRYLAVKFTADATYTLDKIGLLLKKHGTPGTFTVRLRQDSAGNPGTVLATKTLTAASVDDVLGIWQFFGSVAQALTSAADYWLEVYGDSSDNDQNHWKIAVDANPAAGTTKESSNGSTWTASGVNLYWQVRDADDFPDRVFMFEYRGGAYLIFDYDDADPKLFLLGDRGVADSNSGNLSLLNDATKSWTIDEHVGRVVWIIKGPGALEAQPWRVINDTGSTFLGVSPAWKITHTTDTEYVILGGDTWIEVTGVIGTDAIYDVLKVDGEFWLSRGESVKIRRCRQYNNAGTFTSQGLDTTGNIYADRLEIVHHNETSIGKRQLWRALNDTVQVSRADIPAWAADPSFGTGIAVGDVEDKIQTLIEYVDPVYGNKILWVLKKGSWWAVKNDIPDMIPLKEMRTVASDNNSRAALVHNLFLYGTMLKGIERFYNDVLDDVGPNQDRGFPALRQGPIYDMIGYPGRLFACVNAGTTGYSSVHANYGGGWHELYRSDELGQPITRLFIQVIPGESNPDRLYFVEGNQVKWLPLPSETVDPTDDSNYPYTHEGVLVMSRQYAGMQDITKLNDSLKVMADNLEEDVTWIEADYKVDDENAAWTPFTEFFVTSPNQEINFVESGNPSVTGKFVMVRLRFQTSDQYKSPHMRATLTNTLSRIPTKFGYVATVRLSTQPKDLLGNPDDYYEDGLQKILDLDALAETLIVLEMTSVLKLFDEQRVVIDAPTLRPYKNSQTGQIEGYIGTLPITQVYRAETGE